MSRVNLVKWQLKAEKPTRAIKVGADCWFGAYHAGRITLSNWASDTENTFTKMFRKGDMLFDVDVHT
jgi:hypothetical protein